MKGSDFLQKNRRFGGKLENKFGEAAPVEPYFNTFALNSFTLDTSTVHWTLQKGGHLYSCILDTGHWTLPFSGHLDETPGHQIIYKSHLY